MDVWNELKSNLELCMNLFEFQEIEEEEEEKGMDEEE
jgi:hypothetical protein